MLHQLDHNNNDNLNKFNLDLYINDNLNKFKFNLDLNNNLNLKFKKKPKSTTTHSLKIVKQDKTQDKDTVSNWTNAKNLVAHSNIQSLSKK